MSVMTTATGSGYVHATWEDEMAETIGIFSTSWNELKVMKGSLEAKLAPPAQLEHVEACIAETARVGWRGVQILAGTNERYRALLVTYAHLGGQVAGDKAYHQNAGR